MTGPGMSEADLQRCVIEAAQLLHYRVAHFRPARVTRGGREIYETPVAADGKGWPDLTLAKPGRLIFVELKADRGKLSPQQDAWLETLTASSPDAEVYVWRVRDWLSGHILHVLRDPLWLNSMRNAEGATVT